MTEQPADAPASGRTESGALVDYGIDGTILVDLDGKGSDEAPDNDGNFDENLAEHMDDQALSVLADALIADVDADEQARADWKNRLDQGLELLGLRDRPDDEEPFKGASSATHPLIAEAIVQFQARAMPEIAPVEGPAKTRVVGDRTEEFEESAERTQEYLNYRLMVDDEEWWDDTDQMLFYLPFGGSAFRKLYRDEISGMAKARYVKAEDFIVPYKARSLANAQRYTHSFEMHAHDIERAMAAGTYRQTELDTSGEPAENDSLEDTADKREYSVGESDAVHRIYEVHTYRDIGSDRYRQKFALPYIITVDVDENTVLSIRRNWREDDEHYRKQVWFSHYKFLPGFGFYGFGFLHMIGGLAQASTGALRALLDSAAFENLQGGFKSKEARNAAGDSTLEQGKWKDIDLDAETLHKAFYTPDWRGPSTALFQLLGSLTEAGQRFASTTDVQVGDASNNAPVGTTVALIEQGQKVFSTIHQRLHRAAGKELRLFAEIDADAMGDEPYPYEIDNESREIRAEDFDHVNVVPVSDPHIFSSTQRIAMAQATVQIVSDNPDLYGAKEKREAHRRLLDAMQVPDAEEILPEVAATRRDPVTENQYMMTGQAVQAWPEQDHEAHIRVHQAMASQYANESGPAADQMKALMQAHLAEHHAHAYRQRLYEQTGIMLPAGLHPESEPEEMDLETENLVARAVAAQVQPAPSPAEREMSAEQAEVQADQKRKDAESQAEQRRKDAAAKAEEKRRHMQWQAEMRRKGLDFAAEERREQIDFAREEEREQTDWEREQARDRAEWQRKQDEAESEAARERRDAGGELALENMQRSVEQPGSENGDDA